VEALVRGPSPMQRVSKAANQWPPSTSPPCRSNRGVYLYQILSSGINRGKYADGFHNSMIHDKDGNILSPLIMVTCTVFRHALLEWQKNKGVCPKPSNSKLKVDRPDRSNYFNNRYDSGTIVCCCAATGHRLLTSPGVEDRYTFLMIHYNTLPES